MNKNKQHFIQWLSLPRAKRKPKTKEELALLLHVPPETLSRWEQDPALQDQVYQVIKAHLASKLPQVMHVILESARGGDIKFIKLVLGLTGRYTRGITIRSDAPQFGIEKYTAILKKFSK